jgi:hypothetical protein
VSHYSNILGPNQACTLFGSSIGQIDISGKSYIAAGYDLQTADLWRRNLLVLIGFFWLFQLTQALAIEFFSVNNYQYSSLLFILTMLLATRGRYFYDHLYKRELRDQKT